MNKCSCGEPANVCGLKKRFFRLLLKTTSQPTSNNDSVIRDFNSHISKIMIFRGQVEVVLLALYENNGLPEDIENQRYIIRRIDVCINETIDIKNRIMSFPEPLINLRDFLRNYGKLH